MNTNPFTERRSRDRPRMTDPRSSPFAGPLPQPALDVPEVVRGLTRKRSALETLVRASGVFLAVFAAGAGLAFFLAPRSGRQLRLDIKHKASALSARIGAAAGEVAPATRAGRVPQRGKAGGPSAAGGQP